MAAPKNPKRKYSDDDVRLCLAMMEDGFTLKDACRAKGFKYESIRDRVYTNEAHSALYARARELYLENRVQTMNEIVDTEEDVQRARLKCDNIKWEASRVVKKYREKQEIEHSGSVDFEARLAEARKRIEDGTA
jgi:hypothetical protein